MHALAAAVAAVHDVAHAAFLAKAAVRLAVWSYRLEEAVVIAESALREAETILGDDVQAGRLAEVRLCLRAPPPSQSVS